MAFWKPLVTTAWTSLHSLSSVLWVQQLLQLFSSRGSMAGSSDIRSDFKQRNMHWCHLSCMWCRACLYWLTAEVSLCTQVSCVTSHYEVSCALPCLPRWKEECSQAYCPSASLQQPLVGKVRVQRPLLSAVFQAAEHIPLQQHSRSPSSPTGRLVRSDFLPPLRSAALIYCSSSSSTSGGQRAADISP